MNNHSFKMLVLILLTTVLRAVIIACAQTASMAVKHPVEVEKMPLCKGLLNGLARGAQPYDGLQHASQVLCVPTKANLFALSEGVLLRHLPRKQGRDQAERQV